MSNNIVKIQVFHPHHNLENPKKENKQKLQIKTTFVNEKLREAIPASVKELPWRKAADAAASAWKKSIHMVKENANGIAICFVENNGGVEWCARLNLKV
ncbi:hypothetical protein DVH24_020328 [Malus domestica]|uniref:Uncharacterized protein n=1 Tax=Malus domestica TaxID=3750 RepID=A0A498J903_MALDO|nr:hypothetical protein DVH24_020328 [Malus domestica]